MPINANIALGTQPQQPVNYLAQMGQALALKAASQDIQGNEALREFYAQGGDTSTAEGRRQLMAQTGAMGSKIIGQQSEILARDVKTQADSLKAIKDNVSLVNSPEGMVEFLKGAYSTPGGALLAKLAPLDKAIAAIPTNPKAFEDYKRNLGLTSDKLFESADAQLRAKVDREGHGVQMRGQNMTSQTAANLLDFNTRKRTVIPGDKQYYTTGAFGDIQPVTGYGVVSPSTMPSAPALPPAAANAFVTRPSVNSLLNQTGQTSAPTAPPVVQPGLPTVANAAAIAAQQNIPRPPARPEVAPTLTRVEDPANKGQMLEIDARTYKGGTVGDPGVLGVARTEKLTPQQTVKLKTEMGSDFKILDNVTAQTNDLLKSIDMLRDPDITKGLKAITGYSGVLTPTFKDASQLAQTRLDNLRGKVIALGKASASMTGAIGSIANQEWKILADQIAAIDPKMGDKALLEQVQLVEDRALGVFERAKEQYGRQYGEYFETLGPQYSTMPTLKPRGVSSSGVDNNNPLLK